MSAVIACDIGSPDVPFARHGPIQDRGSRRNLINLQRNKAPKNPDLLPHTVTRNAAANWKKLLGERHHSPPLNVGGWFGPIKRDMRHAGARVSGDPLHCSKPRPKLSPALMKAASIPQRTSRYGDFRPATNKSAPKIVTRGTLFSSTRRDRGETNWP